MRLARLLFVFLLFGTTSAWSAMSKTLYTGDLDYRPLGVGVPSSPLPELSHRVERHTLPDPSQPPRSPLPRFASATSATLPPILLQAKKPSEQAEQEIENRVVGRLLKALERIQARLDHFPKNKIDKIPAHFQDEIKVLRKQLETRSNLEFIHKPKSTLMLFGVEIETGKFEINTRLADIIVGDNLIEDVLAHELTHMTQRADAPFQQKIEDAIDKLEAMDLKELKKEIKKSDENAENVKQFLALRNQREAGATQFEEVYRRVHAQDIQKSYIGYLADMRNEYDTIPADLREYLSKLKRQYPELDRFAWLTAHADDTPLDWDKANRFLQMKLMIIGDPLSKKLVDALWEREKAPGLDKDQWLRDWLQKHSP